MLKKLLEKLICSLKYFSIPANSSGRKTNPGHAYEFVVNCSNYLLSNKDELIGGKMSYCEYFKGGLGINVHEFIPSLPVLRYSVPHYYLPGKNTNSPLILVRGGERMREREGEGERGKEKRRKKGRKEGILGPLLQFGYNSVTKNSVGTYKGKMVINLKITYSCYIY